jgi:hypothetical protein
MPRFGQTGGVFRHRTMPVRLSRLLPLFLLVFATVFAQPAPAAPTAYTGSAPVNSQNDDERAAALKTALANVVIEQTGDAGILARADVAKAVAQADRYVLQYSYRGSDGARTLVAQFDSEAVDAMLARLGLRDAAQAAAPANATTEASVWIGGVRNADDWLRVAGYLARNNFVRSSRPLEARGDAVLMRLTLASDVPHFLDAVAAERTLAVESRDSVSGDADARLVLTQ